MHVRNHSRPRRLVAAALASVLLGVAAIAMTEAAAPSIASAAQDPASCQGQVALVNGGFEDPVIPGSISQLAEGLVPGWSTTDRQHLIEIWKSGFLKVPSAEGRQFAELNATSDSRLFQDVVTAPGQTLSWSLRHRGRAGTDVMRVVIGAPGGTLVQNGPTLSDGTAAWGKYTGSYTVPAGQTMTRLGFEAVSSATGDKGIGNFLDDITFGTGPCLITNKTVTNLTRTGTTAEVGDTLRYSITTRNGGGNPALSSVATDVLPSGVDYVPGSIKIASGPGTGTISDPTADDRGEYTASNRTVTVRLGDSATSGAGGSIGVDSSTSFTVDARVNAAGAGTTIRNEAKIAYLDNVAIPSLDRTSTSDAAQVVVSPAADLAVTKTLDTADVVAGRPATFTITATNNGPQTATGVVVSDPVPTGMTGVTATLAGASCTVTTTVTCSVPDMTVGQRVQIRVTGTVQASRDPGVALSNTASIRGTLTDLVPGNNTASATGTISTAADVSITKTLSPSAPVAGQDVTYTLTARNDGASDARDVTINDPLDPETTFVRATSAQGVCATQASVLSCPIGTLAPGASVEVTVVARIASGATAAAQNTATVTSSTSDPDPDDNAASVSFQPSVVADMAVTKTASTARVSAGDPIDFTLAVRNLGTSDAANAVVDDTLPAGLTVTGVDAPTGATCTNTTTSIRCSWPTFADAATSNVVVHAAVAADAPAGSSTNTASVSAPADDRNTANNSDSVDVEVVQTADVSVRKTSTADPVPGAPHTYTMDVRNGGPSTARAVTVADVLPDGFSFGSASDGCALVVRTVRCDIGDLASTATATVSVTGTWAAGLTGTVRNTASVDSSTPDPNTANNTSTDERTLAPRADVVVTKTSSTPSIRRGGQALFQVTVRNDGPSSSAAVVVADAVPAGLIITGAVPSIGSWSAADAQWTVGTLAPGASETLAVTASVVAEGSLTNTASATSQTQDPTPTNNAASSTITATASADLTIMKTASVDPASVNGTLTYTIVVANDGPSAASAVRVTDPVPAALLAPTTTTAGCTVTAGTLGCTVATLASGATFTATVSGTVDPATAATDLSNTATVSSATADPDPSDNTSTAIVAVAGTPLVELVKTAAAPTDSNADGRISVGDTVAYTFRIRNTGTVTLTSAAIADPLLGGTVACAAFAAPLAPGAEVTCAPVTFALTQADLDRGTITNDASVTAQSARGTATDDASATATVPAVNSIALTKSSGTVADANSSGRVDAGDTIAYTFTVTNTGTTTLRAATITDPMLGGAVTCTALDAVALAPGDSVRCAPVAYTLVQRDIDAGAVRNTASTTANAPTGTVTDSATASADLDRTAGLQLTKTAGAATDVDLDGVIGSGDTVAYSFSVRNTGATTLTSASVSDPLLRATALCDLGSLAPDGVAECGPFTYTLTQDDVENELVTNTATASATSQLGAVTDDASVDVVIEGASAIELTKTSSAPVDANGDGRFGAGDTVDFSFTLRNTGTTVLRDAAIDDPLLGGAVGCPALNGLELARGASVDCGPVRYTLTQADVEAGVVRNTATVTAASVRGAVRDDASAEVSVVGSRGIALTKTAGGVIDTVADGRTGAGDTIGYSFSVRNTGTTELRNVVLTDPLLGGALTCAGLDGATLAPGAQAECGPITYTLTQADVERGVVRNTSVVVGVGAQGSVTDTASADVQTVGVASVALTKVPGAVIDTIADGRTGAGDTVGYTFQVRNTGTVALRDVAIDDPMLGGAVVCPALDGIALAPGASADCGPITYTLTQADADAGTVRNTASVGAASSVGRTADDTEADVLLPATNSVELGKTAGTIDDANGDGMVGAGDTATYTFTVTNTGTTTLRDARITDPMLGGSVECSALDDVEIQPGQTVTCASIVHTLALSDVDRGKVRNEASLQAIAPRDAVVDDTASIDVAISGSAGVDLAKTVGIVTDADGDGAVGEGDTVAYAFVVRNVGTTTLRDLAIDDPMLGGAIDCPAIVSRSLVPGESAACGPVTYTLAQDDIESERIRNTATVTASGPLGLVDDEVGVDLSVNGTSGVELTKTPDAIIDATGDGMIGAGDTVGYRFTIRNTGTAILRDIVIDDPMLGGAIDCPSLRGLELAPQTEASCGPMQYTLVQSDIDEGTVHNVAAARAQSVAGAAEDSAEVDVAITGIDRMRLQKSAAAVVDANGTARTDAGDTIAYSFTVTNLGTTTLSNIAVSDPRLDGDVVCEAASLDPAAATVCSAAPAVLTQAEIDAGVVLNTATATAAGRGGNPLTAESSVRTPLENQPSIALAKTGGDYVDENGNGTIDAGDTVAFRFVVTNTGARTLTGIAIDDPMLGGAVACELPDLAPGGTAACGPARYRLTASDAAAGVVVNVATVRGAADAVVVTGAATATVDVATLALTGGVVTALGWVAMLLLAGGMVLLVARRHRRDDEV